MTREDAYQEAFEGAKITYGGSSLIYNPSPQYRDPGNEAREGGSLFERDMLASTYGIPHYTIILSTWQK